MRAVWDLEAGCFIACPVVAQRLRDLPVRWLLRSATRRYVAKQPPALPGGGAEADGGQRCQSLWPSRILVFRLETPRGPRTENLVCPHDSTMIARVLVSGCAMDHVKSTGALGRAMLKLRAIPAIEEFPIHAAFEVGIKSKQPAEPQWASSKS